MKSKFLILIVLLGSIVSHAQTVSEVYFPQYIQGAGTFNAADDHKVPFVTRLALSGLTPNATYRYFNRFVVDPSSSLLGNGTVIFVKDTGSFVRVVTPSLAIAGLYGEFITDAAGAYTGWFAGEPTTASVFKPGNSIYFRLVLNDGAGGGGFTTRITVANPVKVINFGTTADTTKGTGLRATPFAGSAAKQFVFVYDNLLAQGRPVTGTFIESDGTANTIANGYAPFYADSVDGKDRNWGTIVPNPLPNGIQRIDRFDLATGVFKKSYFPYPVIESWHPFTIGFRWPSVNNTFIDTKNPTGGLDNVLVIDGGRVLGISLWLGEQASEELITLQWATPAEEDAVAYTVEKSVDGGKTFRAVSTVQKGANRQIYEQKDGRNETTSLYRVVMTAKDGSKTASEVLKVQGVIKINVYPNPVVNQLLVQHPQAEAGASIQVVGMDGRQLLTRNVQEGTVQTKVDVKNLVSGNYMVIFRVNGMHQSKLFLKQ
jgi:hypothetical protein